jgi:hypothetical protein
MAGIRHSGLLITRLDQSNIVASTVAQAEHEAADYAQEL